MKRLLVAVVFALATAGVASGESTDGYLHNLAAPPLCALPWQTPDPSLSICQARFLAPRLALTSQSVLLRIGDFEATQADCTSYDATQTTTFAVDGAPVPVTTQPCRFISQSVDNVVTLPLAGAQTVWGTDFRYLIPAGSLAPGTHTVTWTATFSSDWSYSLGCTDPSGRCTVPAGTVWTETTTLTITS